MLLHDGGHDCGGSARPVMKGSDHMRLLLAAVSVLGLLAGSATAQQRPHNVLLFVADGLRPGMVTPETAPTIASLL
jgi:hypothetical protein